MTSIRYAIRSETPEHDWVTGENGHVTNRHTFSLVPQSLAEGDDKNGMCAVFTTNGDQASPWIAVNDAWVQADLQKIKEFPPMNDMFNSPLKVGDYALSAFNDRSNYLSLCRVVGFTNKQVRVHNLSWNRIMSRNAAMLVRVHELVITPEP